MFPGKIILGTFVFGRNVLLLRSFDSLRSLKMTPNGLPFLWRVLSLRRVILSEVEGSVLRQVPILP